MKAIGSKIDRGLSGIIYSDPGIGKTTMASTLEAGKTLIINSEGGYGPLLGTGHVVFNLTSIDHLDSLYKDLLIGKYPEFKYIVLDNVSDIEQKILLHLKDKRGKEFVELREYGDGAFKIKEMMINFRNLTEQGRHVIFMAWEQYLEIKQDAGMIVTKCYPKLSKKVAPVMCGIVDFVGHLEVHEKSQKRWVRFGPSDQYITKCQFKGLEDGEVADLPIILSKIMDYEYDVKKGKK